MDFKVTKNIKQGKQYYYVDNKRVSKETYNNRISLCLIKRLNYNSSLLRVSNVLQTATFSYN